MVVLAPFGAAALAGAGSAVGATHHAPARHATKNIPGHDPAGMHAGLTVR